MRKNWTSEIRDDMAGMLKEGLSASQIAAKVGGVTRNAVIGIIHRDRRLREIGFKRRPGRQGTGTTVRSVTVTSAPRKDVRGGKVSINRLKPKPETPPEPVMGAIDVAQDAETSSYSPQVAGVSLMMLNEHRCKWPLNDGGPFLFCGEAKGIEGPYCAFHASLSVGEGTVGERVAFKWAQRSAR